ncbi:MAG: lytic transglycosylase F [Calditrichaeota bacterium]|nr:MAG: lytic transglycosylase F [Calditrichota bacterium]
MGKRFITLLIFILVLWGCQRDEQPRVEQPKVDTTSTSVEKASLKPTRPFRIIAEPQVNIDLPEIRKRGRLIALTGYSATSYFIYKGEPMGFEYELLQHLARDLKLDLDIVVVRNLDEIFNLLNEGKGDLVAYSMTITKERKKYVDFTDHHTIIRQVLVQRKPDNWRQMKQHEIERKLIRNVTELIGKKIYVRKGSSYYHRLVHLSDEIGGDIDIVEVPGDVSTEELIGRVSRGEIDYTVADENVAQINAVYYQNIDIKTPISLGQRIAWAVRKNSPQLKHAINVWLKHIKREPTFNILYSKYHLNKRFYRQRVKSEFSSLKGGKISPYDDLIKKYAKELGWDWRLLASQIYQESQFDPQARSWAGARGLMQLMPATAKHFGAQDVHDPHDNIATAVRYLKWLTEYWKFIPDSTQRMKFILASYNVGQGHVEDARNLARKYGKDPDKWDGNVEEFILKKSHRKYFNDEVVHYGYCRGEEPVNYVREILERYEAYKKFIKG